MSTIDNIPVGATAPTGRGQSPTPGGLNPEPAWKKRDRLWAAVFLGPQAVGIGLFTLVPFAFSLYLAFFEWNGLSPMKFVGLENFVDQVQDPLFMRSVLNTLIIAAVTVPIGLFLAIVIAVFLNRVKRRAVIMVMFFAPVVTSSVAVALIWQQLLRGTAGCPPSSRTCSGCRHRSGWTTLGSRCWRSASSRSGPRSDSTW